MRDKPYCKAPWIGLTYESTVGCKPCCEWRGDENSSFPGTYTDYIKSDYLKNFKAMMYEDDMNKGCQQCIDFEERNLEDLSIRLRMSLMASSCSFGVFINLKVL